MSNYYYMWPCGVWSAQQCDNFWVMGGGIPVVIDAQNDSGELKSCTQSNGTILEYKIGKVEGYAPQPSLCALLIPQNYIGGAYSLSSIAGSYDDCPECANAPVPESNTNSSSATALSSSTTTSSLAVTSSEIQSSAAATQSSASITQSSAAATQSSVSITQSSAAATQSSAPTQSSSTASSKGCCMPPHGLRTSWFLGSEYDKGSAVRRVL